MNYYNFHIGDYVTATVHLEPLEDLAYRRLLDMYYDTEHPIPLETHQVSRRLRLDTQVVDSVLKEFFTLTENGWANGRCDADIAAYHRKAEANKANGKLGGRPKKTHPVILANPNETQLNLNQEPRTKNQDKHAPKAAFSFKTELLNIGVAAELVADWLAVRKTKKATNTKTALDKFNREVAKSGWTHEQAIRHCVERNWQGFEADWVKDIKTEQQASTPQIDTSIEARRDGLQRMADHDYQTRAWLPGERRYRTVVYIEGGAIKRTKHYEQEAAA